ncbi:hypothetical protein [Nocardioides sp.]|uniref:hypothetical protein n=1 Tax=Nocardioides sp. TaxID=35761 RepID=UPI001A1D35DA|nr:hypothetical protein [Nocardioides sp.]MBJ7359280.1 hypothetical protein [Nocardioides sp.]
MRRLTIIASTLLLGVATAVVPSPASAAAGEFGSTCTATQTTADEAYTIVLTASGPANLVPVTAPSAGVITKARFTVPAEAALNLPHKVKVVRGTSTPGQYTVTAESGLLAVTGGTSTFDVRLPVAAGDLLGLYGTAPPGTLYCDTSESADVIGVAAGDVPAGATAPFGTETGYSLPVVATVEPDADKDGFGDVTQDKCPELASAQGECPVVVIDSFATPQGSSIVVIVATDNKAKVKVTGKTKVDGAKIKLRSGAKTVRPGTFGRFKVKLPTALRDALATLSSSKFIKVTLVATATDELGRKTKDKTSVRLYGAR